MVHIKKQTDKGGISISGRKWMDLNNSLALVHLGFFNKSLRASLYACGSRPFYSSPTDVLCTEGCSMLWTQPVSRLQNMRRISVTVHLFVRTPSGTDDTRHHPANDWTFVLMIIGGLNSSWRSFFPPYSILCHLWFASFMLFVSYCIF